MAKDLNAPCTGIWIDGTARDSEGREVFESLNPDDDIVCCSAAKESKKDVLDTVASAKRAFASCGESPAKDRESRLQKAAGIMENWDVNFVDALIGEIGSPIKKAKFEFRKAIGMLRAARHAPFGDSGVGREGDEADL